MAKDLFSSAAGAPRPCDEASPPAPISPVIAAAAPYAASHRCVICGGFAPFGRGLPHRGEVVQYFCEKHKNSGAADERRY